MAADPYGRLAALQDAEAARAAIQEIPYTESEHSVNPFRGTDQTAQAIFMKNAPPGFAEFCQHEAKDVEIPLFGKNRNLTIEGSLAKNPAFFALMKTAQQIRDVWAREDVATARAERAAAEDKLKKLAEVAA